MNMITRRGGSFKTNQSFLTGINQSTSRTPGSTATATATATVDPTDALSTDEKEEQKKTIQAGNSQHLLEPTRIKQCDGKSSSTVHAR